MQAKSDEALPNKPPLLIGLQHSQHHCIRRGAGRLPAGRSRSSRPSAFSLFGHTVATNGSDAIVGAPWDNYFKPDGGAAYLFSRSGSTWAQVARLTAPGELEWEVFGSAVAMGSEHAFVGSYLEYFTAGHGGAVHVLRRSNGQWTDEPTLHAGDTTPEDFFGYSIAIDAETLVIGAPGADRTLEGSGAVYDFGRKNHSWIQVAKLHAVSDANIYWLGQAIAIDQDTIATTAFGYDADGNRTTRIITFVRTAGTWIQEAVLIPADSIIGDYQNAVAIQQDTLVVGTPCANWYCGDPGSAAVFERNGSAWTQETVLTAPDGSPSDQFGMSVSIDGDTVVIGASGDDDAFNGSGSAFVFSRSGNEWTHVAKLLHRKGENLGGGVFGWAMARHGDMVLLGAYGDGYAAESAGAAYVFSLRDWDEDGVPNESDDCPSSMFRRSVDCNGRPLFDANADCRADGDDLPTVIAELSATIQSPSQPDDSDGDGVIDAIDVCPATPAGIAVDCQGRPRRDANQRCTVDGQDIPAIVAELLQRCPP